MMMLQTCVLFLVAGVAAALPHAPPPGVRSELLQPRPPPEQASTVWQYLQNNHDLFASAIVESAAGRGIVYQLNRTCSGDSCKYYQATTMLAPTDAAFAAFSKSMGPAKMKTLLGDYTAWEYYIGFHELESNREAISTRQLAVGDKVLTMAAQHAIALTVVAQPFGLGFQTPSGQSAAITKPDNFVGRNFVHAIDSVLIPPELEPQGKICNGTRMDGCPIARKRRQEGPGGWPPPTPDKSDYTCKWLSLPGVKAPLVLKLEQYMWGGGTWVCVEDDCGQTMVRAWDGRGYCCPEMGGWRHDGGYGSKCPAKDAGPAKVPTTMAPLPMCPEDCLQTWTACVRKYGEPDNCMLFASQGRLCNPSGKGCNGEDFLKHPPVCPDIQTFQECGSPCEPDCIDPVMPMICIDMCVSGCFCPRSNEKGVPLLWDEVTGTCVTPEQCPDADTCDNTIEADYLDTGGITVDCKSTGMGDVCSPASCLLGCTAANQDAAGAKYDIKCKKSTTETECVAHKECQWGGTVYGGQPPTFVCGDEVDSETGVLGTIWMPQNVGTCQAGGGTAMSMCDYFAETECLGNGKCDNPDECTDLASKAYGTCRVPCATGATIACAACIENVLLDTVDVNGVEADLEACCGCLIGAFESSGMSDAQITMMLTGDDCAKKSPIDEDDDMND